MMSGDPAKDKDELLKGIDELQGEVKRVQGEAREVLQNAQFVSDTLPEIRLLYNNMATSAIPSDEWARQKQNMDSYLRVMKSQQITDVSTFGPQSLAFANTAVSGVMMNYTLPMPGTSPPPGVTSPPYPPPIQKATERLAAIVEQYPSLDRVRAELQRLGLDSRSGSQKTAMQLLEDARMTIEIPVGADGSGVGALIVIRECINACLAELVRRRPRQEETGNQKDKVISIGGQCHRGTLDTAYFERLGDEAKNLNGQLSGAKQGAIGRDQVQLLFSKALLFLASFLGSIDEVKPRPA